MPFFEAPTSFRLRQLADPAAAAGLAPRDVALTDNHHSPQLPALMTNLAMEAISPWANHDSHPNFLHLAGLVCEAVLEVVFVALPGYLAAWMGMFDANSQKFVAELNTMVFTPCLIFHKLASKLDVNNLGDLVIIPMIFLAQTLVSYCSAQFNAWAFGFNKKNKKMQKNFIVAMGVFGNSNSLPISLVLSLSHTISGLHWDRIPGDDDSEVAARGILYLMIFQQLGQMLRWTWGYNVLLRPASAYKEEEIRDDEDEAEREERITEEGRYRDDSPERVLVDVGEGEEGGGNDPRNKVTDSGFGSSSGSQTPMSSSTSSSEGSSREVEAFVIPSTPIDTKRLSHSSTRASAGDVTNNNNNNTEGLQDRSRSTNHITTFPDFSAHKDFAFDSSQYPGWKKPFYRIAHHIRLTYHRLTTTLSTFFTNIFRRLPAPLQKLLSFLSYYISSFCLGVRRQMNPPLWAMLLALIVASVPKLQKIFFTEGTLVNNSLTSAIKQSGGVAVPLILVVLGANLARSTLPQDQLASSPAEKKEERKLLIAALLSRMIFPTIVMAPLLALTAKYLSVSILDDPIFIIVCFLLTGAPSALQLAQICQINEVFMGAMSNLLVASYVVAIFPSTLTLVLLALEVVEWAVI